MMPVTPGPHDSLLELATRCDALYICPKDGPLRKGPLVVYAGRDSQGRNLIGDIYFNFRMIEQHPKVVEAFALVAFEKLRQQGLLETFDTICGIPHGGRTFGQMLAFIANKRFVYADRKPKPGVEGEKQQYSWDLSQFEFQEGERLALAEDVFNNFQNTDYTLSETAATGATVTLLVGALNRSTKYDATYVPKIGPYAEQNLPVVASIREPYPEYEQDHPDVVADVTAKNVEFEVKKNWNRLRGLMNTSV